ncbi:MAG: purine-nucleoside phosphorylase [Chloroflexota bacterium]|nr:purine-nucleoside phosphorylase [Chloroflexota bacterium]MEE3254227.1 purine-nucleoside phosphorylase [Chloroflexota bacterium]
MTNEHISIQQFRDVAKIILDKSQHRPKLGIILGTGLGALASDIKDSVVIPYNTLPNWPTSTVKGHAGRLVVGNLEGRPTLVMQGRAHYYEGYSMAAVGFPVRVMKMLGIDTLFVTNASGGINSEYRAGDVMLISDHINLIGMGGLSPLRGPNISELGPRFPDMMNAYDPELRKIAFEVGSSCGYEVHQGVYAGLAGPNLESPVEYRMLKTIGADAVGMSTVAEVIVARHSGMNVLGISGITNKANLDGTSYTTLAEVLEVGKVIAPKILRIILGVVRQMQ